MATDLKALIWGDWQIPFHDIHAIDVATQIGRAFKPDVIDYNGDILDLLKLSKFPGLLTDNNAPKLVNLQEELSLAQTLIKSTMKEIGAKRVLFKAGNHEFRLQRAIANAKPEVREILELKKVRDILTLPKLLELPKSVEFVQWPNGIWLHPELAPDKNVWLEHGNQQAAKTGYTVSSVMEKRQSSVVIGHVHRLGIGWKHFNGGRNQFGIEAGHLSVLGTAGIGDDLYFGNPFSVADYMNYQQGFALLTYADGEWWPELIRIQDGRAMFRGKLYQSRLQK